MPEARVKDGPTVKSPPLIVGGLSPERVIIGSTEIPFDQTYSDRRSERSSQERLVLEGDSELRYLECTPQTMLSAVIGQVDDMHDLRKQGGIVLGQAVQQNPILVPNSIALASTSYEPRFIFPKEEWAATDEPREQVSYGYYYALQMTVVGTLIPKMIKSTATVDDGWYIVVIR